VAEEKPSVQRVDQFILEQIDTVPHLEALLLAWRKRPRAWSVNDMAAELYVPPDQAAKVLRDLSARGFLRETFQSAPQYEYAASDDQDRLMAQVDITYRHELIRISRMIHAKAPSALRDFARAFRFTKEKD